VGAELGDAGCTAASAAPAQTGGDEATGEEPVAASGFESRSAEETEAMDHSRQLLEELPLSGWTARRRSDLLCWLDELNQALAELDRAVEQEAKQHAVARLLQTHPGVGPVTSLAFVLTLGKIERFQHSRQVVSYLGLNPAENSSGERQRWGAISKQGNPMLRSLLVEAGQSASRVDMELKRAYQRLKQKKNSAIAKVMVARKLAVRLYWMWRTQQPYSATRMQGSPSHLVVAVKTDPLNGRPASQKLVWESEDNNHGRNNRSNR
jgi:Transposase IS116/IS110/IS902 family